MLLAAQMPSASASFDRQRVSVLLPNDYSEKQELVQVNESWISALASGT
jgi:hypothetical protein